MNLELSKGKADIW